MHNDFLRELTFYRQAQAAVLEAIPRLKSMGVRTKRPDDYFAQMAKTDQHMQKIRAKLVSKQAFEERMDKIRKLRELRRFGKKVQVEVQLKRQKEKKDMLDQVMTKWPNNSMASKVGPYFTQKRLISEECLTV